MKCSTARNLISDEIDNELDSAQRRSLEEHLDSCAECRKLHEDFKKIAGTARGLKALSPSNKTWFKIASRIKEEQAGARRPVRMRQRRLFLSPRTLGWVVSTALLLLVLVGALTVGPKLWRAEKSPQQYVLSKLEEAERHHQKAIAALWEAVSAQKETLDPQLSAVFQKNLDIIDTSISDCKQAVLSQPDSIDSRNYLLAAYKEKSSLLEEMMAAGTSPVEQRDVRSIY